MALLPPVGFLGAPQLDACSFAFWSSFLLSRPGTILGCVGVVASLDGAPAVERAAGDNAACG